MDATAPVARIKASVLVIGGLVEGNAMSAIHLVGKTRQERRERRKRNATSRKM
jgi:ABC-type iron transport system FetAB permease component